MQELRALPVDGDEHAPGRHRLPRDRGAIEVDEPTRVRAMAPVIERMLAYVAAHPESLVASERGHVPHLGSA